jgi:N-acetyl-anhydromuramoyl-L-alanine amidase
MFQWIKSIFGKRSGGSRRRVSLNLPSASTTNSTAAPSIPPSTISQYSETRLDTPNKSATKIKPNAVVLHHTSGSYAGSVSWCMNPQSNVSYHCIIARDGRRTVLADDTARCWHAGRSSWQGRGDLNNWSLGLAWEGDTYTNPLGNDAIESALEWLVPRMKKWGIGRDMVLDHRLVSPGRKNDIAPAQYNKFQERLWAALN